MSYNYRRNDRAEDAKLIAAYTENVGHPPVTLYPETHPAHAQWTYKSPGKKEDKAIKSVAVARLTKPGLPVATSLGKREHHAIHDRDWCDRAAERLLGELTCKHEDMYVYPSQRQAWGERGPRGGKRKLIIKRVVPDSRECPTCYQRVSVRDLPIEAFSYWHDGNYTMTFDPCAHETVNVFTGCCAACGKNVRQMVAA